MILLLSRALRRLTWFVSDLICSTSLSSFSRQPVSVTGSLGGVIRILLESILYKNFVVLEVSFALSSILEMYARVNDSIIAPSSCFVYNGYDQREISLKERCGEKWPWRRGGPIHVPCLPCVSPHLLRSLPLL